MPQPWTAVTADPEFQKLSPADQEATRQEYFNKAVAPNVPPEQLSDVRAQFDSQTKPGTTQKAPGVLHYVGDMLSSAAGTAAAFKGGVNHGASFGLFPQAPEATDHPIAAGAGELVGSVMSGGALEKAGASLVGRVAPALVSKVSSALALREGSPVLNLLRLSGHGAMAGAAQGAVSGGVQGAENATGQSTLSGQITGQTAAPTLADRVEGAATGAAGGAALGAAAGGALGPAAGVAGMAASKVADAMKPASQRALKLLADKLSIPSNRLQQIFTDFRASTGRNPSIADVLDARSKADIAPIVQSRGSSQATMNAASEDEATALPGRVQNFVTSNGSTQLPFKDAQGNAPSASTGVLGALMQTRKEIADKAMEPIRDLRIPLDPQSKDVLLSQTLRNAPLGNADRFKINNEIANDHITLGSVDLLKQKLQKVAAADPASSAGVIAKDIANFGRFHSQEYGKMLDDYTAHSQFINGFAHAKAGGTLDSVGKNPSLYADLQSINGAAGLELGARSRMAEQASTESGAAGVINKARQPTAANPNLRGGENDRLNEMANAETQSQRNFADLSGRIRSREDEQAEGVSRGIEAVAAAGGHTLTGFKTHFFSRLLTQAKVRESTANAMTEALVSNDPARIAALPQQIQNLRLTDAQRRRALEIVARKTGRAAGQFSGDLASE